MKTKTRPQRPSPGLGERLSMTEWKKHYVSTVGTAEDEAWPQREPGSNLGRIFVLLLLLHVFIIGAVVLYNIIAPKAPLAQRDPKPQTVVSKPVLPTKVTDVAPAKAVTTAPSTTAKPASLPVTAPKMTNAKLETTPPAQQPAAQPAKASDGFQIYEVKAGDNVPSIAAALGVDAQELVDLNDLGDSELYPTRKLKYRKPSAALASAPVVPAKLEIPAKPLTAPAPKSKDTNQNLVTNTTPAKPKAETAAKTMAQDKAVQQTPPAPLKSESKPKLPEASPDEVPHAVPYKGNVEDQLPAAKPKVKHDDLPAAKPKSEKSKDGEKKKPKTEKSETKSASKEKSSKKTHVVGSHDTLYSISRKYGVSVSALQKANNIKDPNVLRDGSKLVIPSKPKND